MWLDERGGGSAPYEVRQAIAQVRHFIEAHGDSRFDDITTPDPDRKPVANRAGFRRDHGEARRWLIPPEVWRNEVCAGLNAREAAKTLAGLRMLEPDGEGKFSRSETVGGRKQRFYVLKPAIFEGWDEASRNALGTPGTPSTHQNEGVPKSRFAGMTFSGNPFSRCRTCSEVFRGPASRIIGIAKKAQSIPVDLSRPTSKRTRDYDCGPQARAAAQLSAQRIRAEGPRFLSDAIRPCGEPPARVVAVGTRIATSRPRSVRWRRRAPPRPGALWGRCQVERSLPGYVLGR